MSIIYSRHLKISEYSKISTHRHSDGDAPISVVVFYRRDREIRRFCEDFAISLADAEAFAAALIECARAVEAPIAGGDEP